MMRRYPRINGPAVLPLFCLAPHGVFRASQITPRAVSSYLAFSPLPDLRCQRTGGVFSVTLSVTAVLQPRRPRVFRGMLPCGVRTFLSGLLRSDHLPSRRDYHTPRKTEGEPTHRSQRGTKNFILHLDVVSLMTIRRILQFSNRRRNGHQEPAHHREGNHEFRDDPGEISKDGAPARPACTNEAFACQ